MSLRLMQRTPRTAGGRGLTQYDDNGLNGDRDTMGRIVKKTEWIVEGDEPTTGARPLNSRTYEYGYNQSGRPWLESVAVDGTVVSSYGYDANGNRTSAELAWSQLGYDSKFDASLTEADTEYDAADKLLRYGTKEYSWNNFGQLSSVYDSATNETTSYEYDLYGNLLSVALPDGRTIEYDVDGAGRRVGRRVLDTSGVELEFRGWIYRDLLRPIAEVDAAGNVVARYVYADGEGAKQNGVSQLEIRLGANPDTSLPFDGRNVPEAIEVLGAGGGVSQRLRLVTNQVGTVQAVVDTSTGEVVQRLEYDEFGRVLFDSNPGVQPFGFGGGLYDPEIGSVRFGARDYNLITGRWIARDPLRTSDGHNLYAFIGGDPLNRIDPTGLFCTYWEANSIYRDSLSDAAQNPALSGDGYNDAKDAYRHCLASCRMSRRCGEGWAEFYGSMNEYWGDMFHDQSPGERDMDDFNNSCGRINSRKPGRCDDLCQDSLDKGYLVNGAAGSGY